MFSYRTILEKTTLQKRFKTHQNDANSEMVTRFKLPFFANYYVFAFLFYEKSRILRIDNMPKMPTKNHVLAMLFAAKHLVISYKTQCKLVLNAMQTRAKCKAISYKTQQKPMKTPFLRPFYRQIAPNWRNAVCWYLARH